MYVIYCVIMLVIEETIRKLNYLYDKCVCVCEIIVHTCSYM